MVSEEGAKRRLVEATSRGRRGCACEGKAARNTAQLELLGMAVVAGEVREHSS